MSSRFIWDGRSGRYRWKSNGRFVSRNQINNLTRGRIRQASDRLQGSLDRLLRGDLDFVGFQREGISLLREIHAQGLMLGAGGSDRLSSEDYLELARYLKSEQYPFWRRFMGQLKRGEVSEGQARWRLDLYARSFRVSVGRGEELAANRAGYTHERRFLGACSPHCRDCLSYARRGVQAIGTLPVPARDCACRSNCCCSKRYYGSLEEAIGAKSG